MTCAFANGCHCNAVDTTVELYVVKTHRIFYAMVDVRKFIAVIDHVAVPISITHHIIQIRLLESER